MLKVFAYAFGEPETYLNKIPGDAYITALLGKEHFIGIVALSGEEVVGGLAAYELQKFEQDRREIYIYDLAVAEAHRRRGIATNLINELRNIAMVAERMCFLCRPTAATNLRSSFMNRSANAKMCTTSILRCNG